MTLMLYSWIAALCGFVIAATLASASGNIDGRRSGHKLARVAYDKRGTPRRFQLTGVRNRDGAAYEGRPVPAILVANTYSTFANKPGLKPTSYTCWV